MSRDISPSTRAALYAAETQDVFVILLTIDHPSLAVPIRVCSDSQDTESRANTFFAFPFDLTLPDDEDGRPPRARLVIDNVDRQIVTAIRGLATSPTVLIEIVRAADPDVVEARFSDFRFTNITYDSQAVEGDLSLEDFTAEPFPAACFTPSLFPGLF